MCNKKFAIGFTVLIIIVSALGLYHRHQTQKILNAEPTKVYNVVNTAAQKKQLQPSVTNADHKDIAATDTESDGKVGTETEVYTEVSKEPILEKSNDLQVQQRLKQAPDNAASIGVGDIERDSKKSVKESESSNPFRRLTREEMIERAVAAGMPRDQAERMQPLPPGTFEENLANTLQIISDIIPHITQENPTELKKTLRERSIHKSDK